VNWRVDGLEALDPNCQATGLFDYAGKRKNERTAMTQVRNMETLMYYNQPNEHNDLVQKAL
jgi:hypothetical protein